MNLKISHYIFFSFSFILLLFLAATAINYKLSEDVKDNADYLGTSQDIVKNCNRFQRNVLNMVSGLRGYLLTGEREFIIAYDEADKDNELILGELSVLLKDSVEQRLFKNILRLNHKWTDDYTDPLKTAKAMAIVSDSNLDKLNKIYKEKYLTGDEREIQNELQQQFKAFINYEYKLRDERRTKLTDSLQYTKIAFVTITIIFLIVGLIIVRFLINKIETRIAVMSQMANEIAMGNYGISIAAGSRDEFGSLERSLNHMARELQMNIDLLKKSNAELDEFAYVVSHDMKGPLRGVDHVVSWIEEDHGAELSPKVQEYMSIIKKRIVRGENLINGLLAYARVGREMLPVESVDVRVLLEEIFEDLAVPANTQLFIATMPIVQTERLLLYQVFQNLISNAIKYNDKEQCIIKIEGNDMGDVYEFSVSDNGRGIASTYHDRIFSVFETLNDSNTIESTGVGLAIVKKIIKSKDMRIRIISEPGNGATFSFTWPK